MLPASHRGNGTAIGTPDTCNTPSASGTTPIPYVNTGENTAAAGFSNVVLIASQNAMHVNTKVTTTSGDEAGTAHASIKGTETFLVGNAVVFIEKLNAVTLSTPTTHNNNNCPSGTQTAPSASGVLFTRRPSGEIGPDFARVEGAPLGFELRDGVGIATILGFTRRLPGLLAEALRRSEPRALVIDLRGCPGGHLEAAARAADLFVPRGSLLFERRRPDGSRQPFQARRAAVASLPLVLVIDGGTASAAELFAGALAQLGRATLVGEPSFGKSAALSLVADGEAYRLADDGTCLLAGDRDLATHPLQPHHPCPAQDALSEAHSLVLPLVLPLALPAGDRSWTS